MVGESGAPPEQGFRAALPGPAGGALGAWKRPLGLPSGKTPGAFERRLGLSGGSGSGCWTSVAKQFMPAFQTVAKRPRPDRSLGAVGADPIGFGRMDRSHRSLPIEPTTDRFPSDVGIPSTIRLQSLTALAAIEMEAAVRAPQPTAPNPLRAPTTLKGKAPRGRSRSRSAPKKRSRRMPSPSSSPRRHPP